MCLQHQYKVLSLLFSELLSAGRRLMALGEDVTSIETTLKLCGVSLVKGLQPQRQMNICSQYDTVDLKPAEPKSSLDLGSRLALGSAADLDSLNQGAGIFEGRRGVTQQDSMRQDDFSSKRKRVDSRSDTEHQTEYALRGGGFENSRSRDQMPPPPIPMQQRLVSTARVPSSDVHGLNSQRDHVNAVHFQRGPFTPQEHPAQGSLSHSMFAPGSFIEPSGTSLAEARTNNGHSHINHPQSPRANTAVYARGGWQPLPASFDTERSGNYSSLGPSLPSTGQPPARRSMSYHQGSLMFPIEAGDHTIDPSSRSYQSVSSDGSLQYQRRQTALAKQSQFESPAHSSNHNPSPNRESRITLPRTPFSTSRHSFDNGIGLSSHIRSSSRQTNHQSANSSSHREQLVTATPAHQRGLASARFPSRQTVYSSSLPSLDVPNAEMFRRNNSFDSGPTPVNGEIRPHSSINGESYSLAQDPRAAQNRGRVRLMEPQALGPRRRANRQ